ncbi:protochlorophyllide reductase [Saccharopolyspora erythraea NRRL 2338]|uniref:Oxidoreductase, short-chain dehydrogenase/reductase family n=2 Tax=Saccharopolyspora erythraea TaxID=1836 RepID=A4FA71_SACEN|nr:oxidoreductase [Saccharopolyspora erythraea]EQD83409.1 short-chain dehydrogenase [Saccharopolyspora erythraea D]PFG94732.1 protochlorophyllide reductase [Saccharopolyspora erythraea NRRL 2338]QRK91454.1 SDR family NAD(P)-dependent oxidoreductase [Saccharopolyspora erythraea]CAM00946.1 oxidoreductase, short-chain dehydrogenase/reductase family [Saccharopolyspora erythraea NRRL 2338]
MAKWTAADIPDQSGRIALITGANSGLGLHSARALAARGAKVLLACRSPERGRAALAQVAAVAETEPELVELDLADLASVRKAAADVRDRTGDALDVLMNNAGVMATPRRSTRDGFELQIGTNHLGHAALTWLLMPALRERAGARVVTVSSLAHSFGTVDVDDLDHTRRRYSPIRAYGQAKLANLMFALELDRRLRHHGMDVLSVAAHPGMSRTELPQNSARLRSAPAVVTKAVALGSSLITQPVSQGILPQLHAAAAPDVRGGQYFGPDGFREVRGHPAPAKMTRAARDEHTARRLWNATSELTGVEPDPS